MFEGPLIEALPTRLEVCPLPPCSVCSGLDVLPKFAGFIKSSTPEEAAEKEAELVAALGELDAYLGKPRLEPVAKAMPTLHTRMLLHGPA